MNGISVHTTTWTDTKMMLCERLQPKSIFCVSHLLKCYKMQPKQWLQNAVQCLSADRVRHRKVWECVGLVLMTSFLRTQVGQWSLIFPIWEASCGGKDHIALRKGKSK